MNMCPLQMSPPRTPGSNEYVPLAGVPSKNTGQMSTYEQVEEMTRRLDMCGDVQLSLLWRFMLLVLVFPAAIQLNAIMDDDDDDDDEVACDGGCFSKKKTWSIA
ncbi:hypothetical protein Tco_0257182 [Tanacetum coccineum]